MSEPFKTSYTMRLPDGWLGHRDMLLRPTTRGWGWVYHLDRPDPQGIYAYLDRHYASAWSWARDGLLEEWREELGRLGHHLLNLYGDINWPGGEVRITAAFDDRSAAMIWRLARP